MKIAIFIIAGILGLCWQSAFALCAGDSIENEFAQSTIVVKAKLISQIDAWNDYPDSDYLARWGADYVSLYGLRVEETYKNASCCEQLDRIYVWETHDSGAFYVDRDSEYLLFLMADTPQPGEPTAELGTYYVKFACGQSRPWSSVKPDDLTDLSTVMKEYEAKRHQAPSP